MMVVGGNREHGEMKVKGYRTTGLCSGLLRVEMSIS